MMVMKGKKPEEKEGVKDQTQVIPPRSDTPKLYVAALEVTKHAGIEGTFAKLNKSYKSTDGSAPSTPSRYPVPPPSPMHRRSPIPMSLAQDDDDAVAETADSSVLIRMTPRREGEELLSVEVPPAPKEEQDEK